METPQKLLIPFADTESLKLTVTIERVAWEQNGRIIAKAKTDDPSIPQHDELSIIGDMANPIIGASYELHGKLSDNERFGGKQFEFTAYTTKLPETKAGIFHYLVDTAMHVGQKLATDIIEAYGDETLQILKEQPARVACDIAGITLDRAEALASSLQEGEKAELAMIELHQLIGGVLGPVTARKAIRKWGSDAPHIVRRDPFRLRELPAVGFKQADRIRDKLGQPDSLKRHAHALEHAITERIGRDGHTIFDLSSIASDCRQLLGAPLDDRVIKLVTRAGLIKMEGQTITLQGIHENETEVAGKLLAMSACKSPDRLFPAIETGDLADDQAAAVAKLNGEKPMVFILTGPPGTGKTYTLARIIKPMLGKMQIALAAPTGKAAKQMQVALRGAGLDNVQTKTIHSLLEPMVDEDTGQFYFTKGVDDPIEADVFVIDETSMVDIRLARALLDAIPLGARLLIIGDQYQLPSVGPGAVLRDALRAGLPQVELTEIKRNAGRIVKVCHAIKDGGSLPPSDKLDLDAGENWRHIEAYEPADIIAIIEALYQKHINKLVCDPRWDSQVISPTNERGPLSCARLNTILRPLINPGSQPIGKTGLFTADKVVRLKNARIVGLEREIQGDVDLADAIDHVRRLDPKNDKVQIVNGDIGTIVLEEGKTLYIYFRWPGRVVKLPRGGAHLKPAYCMTCHKMQGSEAPAIILPLHASMATTPMWTREWLYTAFSRAKKVLITVGDLEALATGVRRKTIDVRRTTLVELLTSQPDVPKESAAFRRGETRQKT